MSFDIHDKVESGQNRFILGCSGATKLFVFGVNPSTATKEKFDKTIAKVESFSRRKEFQGFVMFNVYPQRATNPDGLHASVDLNLIKQNGEVVCAQVQGEKQPQLWAAWGDLICSRDYLWSCLGKLADGIKQSNPIWNHCGEPTKCGHPRHPSRLAYKEKFFNFDIFEYLKIGRILRK